MKPLITVFTPTFNRGYIIRKLYESLCEQSCFDFEWIVIDDGSNDETKEVFEKILKEDNNFKIIYKYKKNGGKPRAINEGVQLASGRYFFIVDSDDTLVNDAIEKIKCWINEIDTIPNIVGVGGAQGHSKFKYIKGIEPKVNENGYIDATNIERNKYDLDADMCEAYKIEILKKYPFKVWENEIFSPEEIVFNDIALDGYKVRWHKDIIYISDYLEDGLTKGSFNLEKNNPMGYAMLYNSKLKYEKSFIKKLYFSSQLIALSLYGKNINYIFSSNDPYSTILSFPIGFLLFLRRKKQFSK